MSLSDTMLSPPVILAGVALGAVVLLANASQPRQKSSPQVWSVGGAMNAAGYQYLTTQAVQGAETGRASLAADTSRQANFLRFLGNADSNRTQLEIQRNESYAGIVKANIASSTAVQLDRNQNFTRLNMAWISKDVEQIRGAVTMHGQDTQLAAVKAQAKAASKASMWSGISSIVGSVAKVATAALV